MNKMREVCRSIALIVLTLGSFCSAAPDQPVPGDDSTFRPTVMVRNGSSLGSGTVIASVEDETLILTASHVVVDPGSLKIELFRFNLGLERVRNTTGFPRFIEATVVARDPGADLAILRVKGQLAFPYVARIARGDEPPTTGTIVTSIGFDKGQRLIGSSTTIRSVERFELENKGGARPFLVTDHPPELGRSGGGLFLKDGTLVGVCVARAEIDPGRKIGLFSSLTNVRALLQEHQALEASVKRADAQRRPLRQ